MANDMIGGLQFVLIYDKVQTAELVGMSNLYPSVIFFTLYSIVGCEVDFWQKREVVHWKFTESGYFMTIKRSLINFTVLRMHDKC